MLYRVCKSFEVESGHMLSKHPGLCRFPHGHTRRVEVVLCSETLDAQDMVCDFKTLKLAVREHLARLDHAMAVNSADPMLPALRGATGDAVRERVVTFENQDPTTEVLARSIYEFLAGELRAGRTYRDEQGLEYRFPPGLRLERVRVSETSSTWAEYGV
jgi:6-pyruvoyltetrahydropterin/6-carboxytetrahydropterin synthase